MPGRTWFGHYSQPVPNPHGGMMYHEPFSTGKRHHVFWPATRYRTNLEKRFRELPCCVVLVSPGIHSLLHACMDGAPPEKPTEEYMEAAIERYLHGACGCSHHDPIVTNINVYRLARR